MNLRILSKYYKHQLLGTDIYIIIPMEILCLHYCVKLIFKKTSYCKKMEIFRTFQKAFFVCKIE